MSATILVCPSCQSRLGAKGVLPEGKVIRCPSCGGSLTIDVRRVVPPWTGSIRPWHIAVALGLAAVMIGALVEEIAPHAGRMAEIGRGRELFLREWMPDDPRSHGGDGLGPVYNESSCVACHNLGGVGGGGPNGKNVDIISSSRRPRQQETRGRPGGAGDDALGKIHPGFLAATSVVLHRFGTAPEYAAWRLERLSMDEGFFGSALPPNALDGPPEILARAEIEHSRPSSRQGFPLAAGVTRSQRNPTALFGAGLIDSIPDRIIEEASQRSFPGFPEIKGRVGRQEDGRIGRFGWKAQLASLKEFVLTACAVELGLEAPDHPQGGDPLASDIKAPGPDLTPAECDEMIAFVRSLPAPRQQIPCGSRESGEIRIGKELFLSIGCGTCHTPDLGAAEGIYSDLLLHDMGPEGSDVGSYRVFRPESSDPAPTGPGPPVDDRSGGKRPAAGGATEREWRTPPLWGLRDSGPYLHDGRADTLDQAIVLHGGQGKDPSSRYFGLSPRRRQQVQAFLKSLAAPVGSPPA